MNRDDPNFLRKIDEKLILMEKLAVDWQQAFEGVQSIILQRSAKAQEDIDVLRLAVRRFASEEKSLDVELATIEKRVFNLRSLNSHAAGPSAWTSTGLRM